MRKGRTLFGALAVALFSGAAYALPWDIDMVDAAFYRAYEWVMMTLPEGTVSTNMYVQNYDVTTPEGQGLTNPLDNSEATVKAGETSYNIYCTPCHGVAGAGGGTVMDNNPAEGKRRFPIPAPKLAGADGIANKRSDGHIYLTIRNGSRSKLMSGYDLQLNETEMWSVVRYVRTLEGAQYVAPAAPATTTPPVGG